MDDKKQAWNKFISTGKIQDYLNYCSEQSMAVEGHFNHDYKNRWNNSEPTELSGLGKIHDDISQGSGAD